MVQDRPILYLIDGSGYIFRAFFALPQLNNSRGLPTNAVYGFARMLGKLLKDSRPDHLAIIFDAPTKTFRDDISASYKANRPSTPDDLIVQIPFIYRLVDAFRIKRIVLDGFEADDVIGTLAVRAEREGFDVVIVTADKDFMQLTDLQISLWDTMRDRRIGPSEVRERFGVEPEALIDIMALTGDAIDNVKGVPGIGEKTASALIREFGTIYELMKNLDSLERTGIRGAKKLGPLIDAHRDDIEVARRLVTIDTSAPVAESIASLAYRGGDAAAVDALLRELEFNSMRKELAPLQAPEEIGNARELITEEDRIDALADELGRATRINLHLALGESGETLKLSADDSGQVFIVAGAAIRRLRGLLESPNPAKVCHDLKFHLRQMHMHGVALQGAEFDTMLAGFLVNPGRAEPSLHDLAEEYFPSAPAPNERSEPILLFLLRGLIGTRLKTDSLERLYREVEMPLVPVLAEMETAGVLVDPKALRAMSIEFGGRLEELEQACSALAGQPFNLNSPTQVREVLFEKLKLPTKGISKTKSGFSTDVDAMTKLASHHELPEKLLEYRRLAKLKSTYIDALSALINPATGRIHTCFHQALTATGRLSSSDPNLQNIPARSLEGRRIRQAFVAEPGRLLLSADYSQIELRVLAHLSNDPTLTEAFRRDEDIHARTAMEVLGIKPGSLDPESRRLAKVINFGIIYGMGPQRLSDELKIPRSQAAEYIERYFHRLPGVRDYMERCLHEAREKGFVTTMTGRRRYLPEMTSSHHGMKAQAERIAINTPIQGSAADLIKVAMIRLADLIRTQRLGARMLLQVHDELLFEVEREKLETMGRTVQREMEGAAKLAVPLKVELKWGPNWADLVALTADLPHLTCADG